MKNIIRCIVGSEFGFAGQGNEQWYYTLGLVINLMLVWWLQPNIAIVFTALAIIHYISVYIYGYYNLAEGKLAFSIAYFVIHFILLVIAFIASLKWTIITTIISVIAFFLAPDSTGTNILFPVYNEYVLLFNAIIFTAFVIIDFLLPIKILAKLAIIIAALIIHPIIDFLAKDGILISEVTFKNFENVINLIHNKKNY